MFFLYGKPLFDMIWRKSWEKKNGKTCFFAMVKLDWILRNMVKHDVSYGKNMVICFFSTNG